MTGATAKIFCHAVTSPDHPHRTDQSEHSVRNQDHLVTELNDGVIARSLGQQGPDTTHNDVA